MKLLLMLIIIVLISGNSLIVYGEDLFRFQGSNQNTKIVSVEYLPYTPEFATNLSFRANVTDNENDSIVWVNFTLESPSGIYVILSENGTQFNDFWNSSAFVINETGIWTYTVLSNDNDITNTTYANYSSTFNITDSVAIDKDNITAAMNTSEQRSWIIGIDSDTREYLNFTLEYNLSTGNFSTTLNQSYIMVNSSGPFYFNLTILVNESATDGNYKGNITIKRKAPFNRTWVIPIYIEVTATYGDIELVSPSNYAFTMCSGSLTHTFVATNLGSYILTNCHPFLLDYNNTRQGSSVDDGFSLATGTNKTVSITYSYGATQTEEFTFDIECTATAGGSLDSISGQKPRIFFYVASGCGVTGGGAGAVIERELPIPSKPPPPKLEEILGLCGNGICEPEVGETPWSCPEDCMYKILELDQILCLPLFNCGNWGEAWFINFMIITVTGGVLYFRYKTKKVKRRI